MKWVSAFLSVFIFLPALIGAGQSPPNEFVEGQVIGVPLHGPRQNNQAIYFNTNDDSTLQAMSENQWHVIDVSAQVPADTLAVYLSGVLVLTHGSTPGNCDMQIFFRNAGETYEPNYIAQITAGGVQESPREPLAVWVPVTSGQFEVKWTRNTTGTWPLNCSYGMHVGVGAYVR